MRERLILFIMRNALNFVGRFVNISQKKHLFIIIHNMRRAIADTYSRLGQYDQAEKEFKQLIDDVPDNPWGYIGLADMLFIDKNEQLARAETLYKQAIPLAETHDDGDIEAIKERLDRKSTRLK